MTLSTTTRSRIEATLGGHSVVLYMKGSRGQPQCGFSARVVSILDRLVPDYHTVDVLADPEVREGIKSYSDWPTVPQLYIDEEFVGGCDLIQQMFDSGELHQLLGVEQVVVAPPNISISDAAGVLLREVQAQHEGATIQLVVDAGWGHEFRIAAPSTPGLRVVANGVELLFDHDSAARAEGLTIDVVGEGDDQGFVIDNPNAPRGVRQMTAAELKARLDRGDALHLYDVREQRERDIAAISGARLLDEAAVSAIDKLPRDAVLVFHCHSGVRSQAAAEYFVRQGFSDVYNLAGGIDAWSREIDPDVPRY